MRKEVVREDLRDMEGLGRQEYQGRRGWTEDMHTEEAGISIIARAEAEAGQEVRDTVLPVAR